MAWDTNDPCQGRNNLNSSFTRAALVVDSDAVLLFALPYNQRGEPACIERQRNTGQVDPFLASRCFQNSFGGERNNLMPTILFLLFQISANGLQIIVEFGCMRCANLSDLFHNRVFFHDYSPVSSSGEQITGHSYPFSSITFPILFFVIALLIWWKFHVKRKSMAFTVAKGIIIFLLLEYIS